MSDLAAVVRLSAARPRPSSGDIDAFGGWMTVGDVAVALRVCTGTVYRMIADRRLRAVKHAGIWRLRPTEIADYVARLEAAAAPHESDNA